MPAERKLFAVLPYCNEATFYDNENGFAAVAQYRNGLLQQIGENKDSELQILRNTPEEQVSPGFAQKLTDLLMRGMGILRTEDNILSTIEGLNEMLSSTANPAEKRRILLGKAMAMCALNRKESRGAHTRLDFPETSEDLRRHSIVRMRGEEIEWTLREVPVFRGEEEGETR